METPDNKRINWTICLQCSGQGKILRGPSKKRQRTYQEALDAFEMNKDNLTAPEPLESNMDICPHCTGSGLLSCEDVTPVDLETYPSVAIIGGGIGGVALAVACLHRGIPFILYERDESFDARSQGYGLTLQQASKAIEGLGVFSLPSGLTSTIHIVHNPEGKIIGEWGLRKWKKPFLAKTTRRKNIHIARQSLRSSLLEQLGESESLKWGHKLTDFSKNKNGRVDLSFEVGGEKITEQADLVVGADGIRSSVRERLIGEDVTPLQYLGCIVVLGICPLERLENLENPLLDSDTVFQTVNGHERIYIMPYDKDTIMWQLSFPMTEQEAKELSSQGPEAMKKEALKRLKDWHEPIPQILTTTDGSKITGYPVYDRKLLDPELLSKENNTTLLGDAAHPMSPFKGQGANQALLDALSLARRISIECGPDSNWREIGLRKLILNDFEKDMIKRTASKVLDSAKAAHLLHSDAVLHEGDGPRGRGLGAN